MKITLFTVVFFVMVTIFLVGINNIKINAKSNSSVELFSYSYFSNMDNSTRLVQEVMREIRTESILRNGQTQFIYTDNFSGIFIDNQGLLNIALVSGLSRNIWYSFIGNDQIIFLEATYSYNHLSMIKNVILPLMEKYEIFELGVCDRYNHVFVYLTCKSNSFKIINFLREYGIYSESSINFIIDSKGMPKQELLMLEMKYTIAGA